MAKWPVHRKTHRTIQKHVEHQTQQTFRNKMVRAKIHTFLIILLDSMTRVTLFLLKTIDFAIDPLAKHKFQTNSRLQKRDLVCTQFTFYSACNSNVITAKHPSKNQLTN